MRDATRSGRPRARLVLEAVLGLCTLWLVIQNCLLLAYLSWTRLPEATTTVTAVLRTAVLVLGPVWIVGSVLVLGVACTAWLTRTERAEVNRAGWEMNHGRAR